MNWNRLQTFLTVAEAGSFSRAGKKLGLSQSAVSRQITVLESEIKNSVFQRHWRGLVMTEAGEELYRSVKEMSALLSMSVAKINEGRSQPEGALRITTTVAFGSAWLTPRMHLFRASYPEIDVSLLLADNVELDLSLRQADCAIRFNRQTEPNLIQLYLATVRYKVFASAEYLEAHETPMSPEDLDNHQIIVYGEDIPLPLHDMNWLLTVGKPEGEHRKPSLSVNNVYGIFRAVEGGLGVAALPYYLTHRAQNLVQILPGYEGPTFDMYFVYPEELRHSRRINVIRDFLQKQIADDRTSGLVTRNM